MVPAGVVRSSVQYTIESLRWATSIRHATSGRVARLVAVALVVVVEERDVSGLHLSLGQRGALKSGRLAPCSSLPSQSVACGNLDDRAVCGHHPRAPSEVASAQLGRLRRTTARCRSPRSCGGAPRTGRCGSRTLRDKAVRFAGSRADVSAHLRPAGVADVGHEARGLRDLSPGGTADRCPSYPWHRAAA